MKYVNTMPSSQEVGSTKRCLQKRVRARWSPPSVPFEAASLCATGISALKSLSPSKFAQEENHGEEMLGDVFRVLISCVSLS